MTRVVEMAAVVAPGFPPCSEFYVYDANDRLVRVCPSRGMADEVAAGVGTPFDHLSSAELRLELAEAEAERTTSIVGQCRRKNRIRALTQELVERGSF